MKRKNYLNSCSVAIVGGFQRFFYWYGLKVATYRLSFILFCFAFTGLSCIGLLNFNRENNPYELWVPRNSDSVSNSKWLLENFPADSRYNNYLITDDSGNILRPEILREMLKLHQHVSEEIVLANGMMWQDVCKKVPVPDLNLDLPPAPSSSRASDCSDPLSPDYDPSVCLDPAVYCAAVNRTFSEACLERSVLELWGYDEAAYEALTEQDVLDKVNEPNVTSVVFGDAFAVDKYLSVARDPDTGLIVSATAASITWMGQVDESELGSVSGGGLPVDDNILEFEESLHDAMIAASRSSFEPLGCTCYENVARGWDDLARESLLSDAIFIPVGFALVFTYIMVVLGNYHWVETRALLAVSGLTAIVLGTAVCMGLCSAVGLLFSPMHNSVPFILLGIGIDDMFVIIQCYDNLTKDELEWGAHARNIALAMRHAGSAITVTSFTDFIVFTIGATSTLPALSSFCLYCGVGIVAIFFFQATFFVACLSFDLSRIEAGRNGCIPCYRHKDYVYEYKEGKSLSQRAFGLVGEVIMQPVWQAVLALASLALLGVAIWGITGLEVRFESIWFLPEDSYLRQWSEAEAVYYPSEGETATLYMTGLDYPAELYKIENLIGNLTAAKGNINSVSSWWPDYKEYVNDHLGVGDDGVGIPQEVLSLADFSEATSRFLYSPSGSFWQPFFRPADDRVVCGEPLAPLALTSFRYTHERFDGPKEHIPALNEVKDIIADQRFSDNVFPFCAEYANWETDEVIKKELFRNLGVSLACIFVTTLVLLANLQVSVLVMLVVCLVLVNVLGFMQHWGLTIDVVSSINVIISIGLCVDYSAHIAHAFMANGGSKKSRSAKTLYDIGPAVLNGGFSTFVAVVILCTSDSHVFMTFFKVFFLVIVFGLFYGLIMLPIILRYLGPASYDLERIEEKRREKEEEKEREKGKSDDGGDAEPPYEKF